MSCLLDGPCRWDGPAGKDQASRNWEGLWSDLPDWSVAVREVGGVQHLDAGGVVAVERRLTAAAPRRRGLGGRIEPDAEMEQVDGSGRRVRARVGGMHDRGGAGTRSHDERFVAEDPGEPAVADAVLI